MREIKFRAWYLAGEMIGELRGFEYYEDQEEKIDIWKPMIRVFEKDGDEISYPAGAIILMQFTGLRDKNGLAEIYEGDIISPEGKLKGNIYESAQVYEKGIDCLVEGLGTKAWRNTESIAMGFGCIYAE